jgi:hypothetical protein
MTESRQQLVAAAGVLSCVGVRLDYANWYRAIMDGREPDNQPAPRLYPDADAACRSDLIFGRQKEAANHQRCYSQVTGAAEAEADSG